MNDLALQRQQDAEKKEEEKRKDIQFNQTAGYIGVIVIFFGGLIATATVALLLYNGGAGMVGSNLALVCCGGVSITALAAWIVGKIVEKSHANAISPKNIKSVAGTADVLANANTPLQEMTFGDYCDAFFGVYSIPFSGAKCWNFPSKVNPEIFIWFFRDCLSFVDHPRNFYKNKYSLPPKNLKVIEIPRDHILYYKVVGELINQPNVSGGGVSLTGTIVGGLVAGVPGAIIGSRKAINTTNQVVDNRTVMLAYKDKDDTPQSMRFVYAAYDIFNEILPEKDINFVSH